METTIRQLIQDQLRALERMDQAAQDAIAAAAKLINECYAAGSKVLLCGNGGSAADAQHIAGELTGRFLRERPALPSIALNTDTSVLTAIGNDYSYEQVFARQVEAHARPGDVLWAITTSGNSPNVLAAARSARQRGAKVLGFTGRDGGQLKGLSDVCFVAPAQKTFEIQQLHQLAYHIICELVDQQAAKTSA